MGSIPKFNQMGTNSQFDIQVHQPGLFYTNYVGTTQNKDFSTVNRYHISKNCIYKYLLITTKLLDQNPHGDPNLPYSLQNYGVHVDNFSQCISKYLNFSAVCQQNQKLRAPFKAAQKKNLMMRCTLLVHFFFINKISKRKFPMQ